MTSGRKRTPTPIARLRGQPGRRMARTEPQFDAAIPEAPSFIDDEGLAEWRRITSLMSNAGIMTPAYRALLVSYCDTWSDFVRLRKMAEEEVWFKKSENGYPYENPIHIRLAKTRTELTKICEKMGITPPTLSKAHIVGKPTAPTKEQALAEKLFKVPVKK